jgi:deoxyadenosine/deoxycytidine kinase
MDMANTYVVIAGNIGVGKSSLVALIEKKLGWISYPEEFGENPYLSRFYQDMPRWSFNSQIFFLSSRLRQHQEIAKQKGNVIQDRSIFEDAEIFARNLFNQGHMTQEDWNTYLALYQTISTLLTPPTLIVYLEASVDVLVERIKMRGREYEKGIQPDYLALLNSLYEAWASSFSLCPVLRFDTNGMDFVKHKDHLDKIIRAVQENT